ncbi:MAG: hypothetical protein RDV41_03825, partial [Planctomycetota bacterium]|nr:hypothetical protein [Planctomycetota bacterium]
MRPPYRVPFRPGGFRGDAARAGRAQRRASVLIVAMGVLTVLAVLGIFFINITAIERAVSRTHEDMVRAQLLAHSGIEYALAQLDSYDSTLLQRMTYWGEDWDANGFDSLVPASGYPNNGNGVVETANGNALQNSTLETFECSPEFALRPSFFYDSPTMPDGSPDLVTVNEAGVSRRRGYSGFLPSTYRQDPPQNPGNTFSLRVTNQNAKLDMNSLNPHMAAIINNLGAALGLTTTTLGNTIMANRPSVAVDASTRLPTGGYASVCDAALLTVIGPVGSQARTDYDRLKRYLTVSNQTWVDTCVVAPKPQVALPTVGRPTSKQTDDVWFADFFGNNQFQGPLRYDYDFALQPRAPIDVNSAPRQVLIAVLQNLAARIFIVVPRGFRFASGPELSYEGYLTRDTTPITAAQAGSIADAIITFRRGLSTINFLGNAAATGPFGTWEQFDAFVDQRLVTPSLISLEQGQIIKANANPNTRLAKFNNDDAGRTGWVVPAGTYAAIPTVSYAYIDKTDLLNPAPPSSIGYYTTEFCFSSGGYFEIDSVGRVLDSQSEVAATSRIRAVVRAFHTVRHGTQRDFRVNANSMSSARFGYLPESMGDVSSANMDIRDGAPTTGSDLDGQIITAPVWGAFQGSCNRYFQNWDMLDSMPSSVFAQNPTSWKSKDINAFASSAQRRTLFGKYQGSLGSYPNTNPFNDPFRFSDVTHDGPIHGADRYRNNMFSTLGIGSGNPGGNPTQGTLEFWVKPRGMLMPATVGSTSTRQAKGLAELGFWW